MPIVQVLVSLLAKSLLSLVTSLLTETVLKRAIILSAAKVVKKTKNTYDDAVFQSLKDAWAPEIQISEAVQPDAASNNSSEPDKEQISSPTKQ